MNQSRKARNHYTGKRPYSFL